MSTPAGTLDMHSMRTPAGTLDTCTRTVHCAECGDGILLFLGWSRAYLICLLFKALKGTVSRDF